MHILNTPLRHLYFFLLVLVVSSCENPNDVGLNLEDNILQAYYTDTVTVNVSTVLVDSIVTSGTGVVLAGQYEDALTGRTIANSFFQLDLDTYWSVSDEAVFDSIQLLLPYSGYSYGDTTQWVTLEVNRLTENIEEKSLPPYVGTEEPLSYFYGSSALYNTSKVRSEAQALSMYAFQPRPSSKDTLFIPLPDALGREWLSLKKASDNRMTLSNYFTDYFKGLKVSTTSSGTGGAIVGFNASGVVVRLFYKNTTGTTSNSYIDFPLVSSTQFNQLLGDYSQSVLNGIKRGGNPVSSASATNVGVAQAGTGLMIRLEFPYLDELRKLLQVEMINMAVLEVVPAVNTNKYPYPVPSTIALYKTDKTNVPLAPLTMDYSTTQQTAIYKADEEYDQNHRYQFGINEYFMNLFSDDQSLGNALLLAMPAESVTQSVDRLVVGGPGHSNKIKLKLYYTLLNNKSN